MDIKYTEVNHVSLLCKDLEAEKQFFSEVIRLKEKKRPDFDFPGAWFEVTSNQEVHLLAPQTNEPVVGGVRSNHFALNVNDFEKAKAHVLSFAFETYGPKQRPDGVWQLFVRSPAGHWVEITQV